MKKISRAFRRYWWVVVILFLAAITFGSLWPRMIAPGVLPDDKARHLLSYLMVSLPIALVRPRAWRWMLAGLLVWSIGIEFVQPFLGRSRDAGDFLANLAGVGIALLLSEIALRLGRLRPA